MTFENIFINIISSWDVPSFDHFYDNHRRVTVGPLTTLSTTDGPLLVSVSFDSVEPTLKKEVLHNTVYHEGEISCFIVDTSA
jgi:hypothetical protein